MPYVDVTAITLLESTRYELSRHGVTLVHARDVGQVRDVLRRSEPVGHSLAIYPTVQTAVDALTDAAPTPKE